MKIKSFREIIHPVLLKAMSGKTPGPSVVSGKLPKNQNCLIVANHFCIEDIPTLGQAVKDHFYLLVSDEDRNTLDGIGLSLNGVKWVHRVDKNSRKKAADKAVSILKKGKNFAMYPEATWNLSPNLLMLPMNYGCIRIALEANVPIVPVITFFADDCRYTKIGEPFYPTEDLKKSIDDLRDIMATMLYEEMLKSYEARYIADERVYFDGHSYYEKRDNVSNRHLQEDVDRRYNAYGRALKDKDGVREFESQFIFTPKSDDYSFFQEFNSRVRECDGRTIVERISSENNGYEGTSFGELDEKEYFGFGYNERVLKRQLNKK